MIDGFFSVSNLRFRELFWIGEFGKYFFLCVARFLGGGVGNRHNLKILGSADCVVRVISCNPFCKFLSFGNSAWDFFGG